MLNTPVLLQEKKLPKSLEFEVGVPIGEWTPLTSEVSCTSKRLPSGKVKWSYFAECSCSCGKTRRVNLENLKRGLTTHCGHVSSLNNHKHGKRRDRIYAIWNAMQYRINSPSCKAYKYYGGRGLDMDPRWLDFSVFYADMGDPPFEDATLERVDNNRGYWPDNVVWAGRVEQGRNKRNNIRYEYLGENLTLAEWAERLGINASTLSSRIYNYGWDVEKALSTPVAG